MWKGMVVSKKARIDIEVMNAFRTLNTVSWSTVYV